MTLGTLQGHSPIGKSFQMGFFVQLFSSYKISTNSVLHGPSAVAEPLVKIVSL